MRLKPKLFRKPRKGHWATKGLVGLWLFNEGSGNKVFDLSGNGQTGTITGASWGSGQLGSILDFGTSGDTYYAQSAKNIGISGSANRTLIVRFRTTDTTNAMYMAGWGTDAGSLQEFTILRDANDATNDVVRIAINGGNRLWDWPTSDFANGNWHTIAVVLNGTNTSDIIGYGEGVPLTISSTNDQTLNTLNNQFMVGAFPVGLKNPFAGGISYVIIYDRDLSASENALLHREPFCMFERDPIELWVGATSVGVPVGAAGIMTTNTGYWGPTF